MEGMRRRKWGQAGAAQALIQSERLQNLTMDESEDLYRSLPISQKRRGEFLDNTLQDIRECIWSLLYEEAPYEIRVWEFLDEMGGYRLQGGGQPLVGALFCTQSPAMFGLVNTTVDKGLRKLGMHPRFDPKESQAGRFQKTQESLWRVKGMAEFEDFRVTDDFLEVLAKGMLEDT